MSMTKKQLSYYKNLDYPIRIDPDPEGGYVASIPDLPGCNAFGETVGQALESLKDTKEIWLESYFETHGEAPEPFEPREFAGRILLRLPKYLHEKLYRSSQSEGVSLNQYLVALLAERHAARASSDQTLTDRLLRSRLLHRSETARTCSGIEPDLLPLLLMEQDSTQESNLSRVVHQWAWGKPFTISAVSSTSNVSMLIVIAARGGQPLFQVVPWQTPHVEPW